MLELKDGSHDKFMIQAVILVKKKKQKRGRNDGNDRNSKY